MPDADLEDLVRRARKYDRRAVETLLLIYYPTIYRIANGLSGRADVARGVIRYVLYRSLSVLPKWDHGGVPGRWFAHHTVLTVRRAEKYPPDAHNDVLIKEAQKDGGKAEAAYVAFVRTLRSLPYQQREAFLLHHGEAMDLRAMATAMDCSTEAASNHLQAAGNALRAIVGPTYDAMLPRVKAVYVGLAPTDAMAMPAIAKIARRYFLPRLVRRIVIVALVLFILGFVAWYLRGWLRGQL